MMRQTPLVAILFSGLLTALVLGGGSSLSTLASAPSADPLATPRPVACDIERRSFEEILALAMPESDDGTNGSGRLIRRLPVGTPADEIVAEGVSATIRELETCINDGQLFRFMALFSDEALRQMPMSEDAAAELSIMAASTPVPIPSGGRSEFIGPWHIEMLPDGRVLAAVVWFGTETDTCIDPNRINALILVEEDGQWLIDERIEDVADGELIDVIGLPPDEPALDECVSSESFAEPTDN